MTDLYRSRPPGKVATLPIRSYLQAGVLPAPYVTTVGQAVCVSSQLVGSGQRLEQSAMRMELAFASSSSSERSALHPPTNIECLHHSCLSAKTKQDIHTHTQCIVFKHVAVCA